MAVVDGAMTSPFTTQSVATSRLGVHHGLFRREDVAVSQFSAQGMHVGGGS